MCLRMLDSVNTSACLSNDVLEVLRRPWGDDDAINS
jgi:hypothetical protein